MSGINIKIGTISTKFHYPYEGIFGKASPGPEYIIKEITGNGYINLTNAVANQLMELKAYGGTEQRNLPAGYIEQQFIYMMDGSYLLTDIVPTYDCKIEMDFQTTSTVSQAATYLSSSTTFRFAHVSAKTFRVNAWGNTYDSTTPVANNTRYKFTYNNLVATLKTGDTTVFTNTFTDTGITATPLTINGYGSPVSQNVEGIYLYSFKVWNAQGELVADYVPAVQKGTVSVVGFYDTVSKTFKTATAGTFAAGGEAVPTPSTPMDIVSNNGVLKYGNTSKNLVSTASKYIKLGEYTDASGNIVSSTVNFQTVSFPCKPNTTYTASISSSVQMLRICTYDASGVFVQRFNTQVGDGVKVITFTTGANVSQFNIGAQISNNDVTQQMIDAITWQIEEGLTATDYEPYNLEIYTDGTVETINAHSKNLFDEQWNRNTGVSTQAATWGNVVTASGWSTSGLIPVKVGQQYTLSFNSTVTSYVFYYEADGTMQQSYDTATSTKKTFTVPAGATHIRLQVNKSTEAAIAALETQLETGATNTTYVPYFDGGTATAEMLLKVGDYQDTQEILSGTITRNVGVKVLDGTENWTSYNGGMYFPLGGGGTLPETATAYCSHFKYAGASVLIANLPENNFTIATNGNCSFKSSDTTTKADWVAWLAEQYAASTPVIVIYLLATPTTESVAGQTMDIPEGNSTIEITQASIDNLGLYAKYKATS